MAGESSPFITVQGLPVPTFVTQEELDKLKDFKLYPDDVWIVTFPKCGTTWMQQIVRLIHNNGQQDSAKLITASPWLEGIANFPQIDINNLTRPRVLKSHFPYDLLPCGPPDTTPCKYIYVMRNPKDVAVSFYYHIKAFHFGNDLEWDKFWDMYVEGKLEFGDYFDHLLSWWPHRNDKNILIMKYEDMKKDLKSSVTTIASFLGRNLSPEVITKIVDMTTFEKMKVDKSASKSHTKYPGYMRKGTTGDWKNHLSADQSAQIDVLCDQKLKAIGLEFDYDII